MGDPKIRCTSITKKKKMASKKNRRIKDKEVSNVQNLLVFDEKCPPKYNIEGREAECFYPVFLLCLLASVFKSKIVL